MNAPGYVFEAGCPRCGGELSHVTSSRPTPSEASAIVVCGGCGEEWQILVRMVVVPRQARPGDAERQRARRARMREDASA